MAAQLARTCRLQRMRQTKAVIQSLQGVQLHNSLMHASSREGRVRRAIKRTGTRRGAVRRAMRRRTFATREVAWKPQSASSKRWMA